MEDGTRKKRHTEATPEMPEAVRHPQRLFFERISELKTLKRAFEDKFAYDTRLEKAKFSLHVGSFFRSSKVTAPRSTVWVLLGNPDSSTSLI